MGFFSELRNLLALKRELRPKPESRIYKATKDEVESISRKQRDFEEGEKAKATFVAKVKVMSFSVHGLLVAAIVFLVLCGAVMMLLRQ